MSECPGHVLDPLAAVRPLKRLLLPLQRQAGNVQEHSAACVQLEASNSATQGACPCKTKRTPLALSVYTYTHNWPLAAPALPPPASVSGGNHGLRRRAMPGCGRMRRTHGMAHARTPTVRCGLVVHWRWAEGALDGGSSGVMAADEVNTGTVVRRAMGRLILYG